MEFSQEIKSEVRSILALPETRAWLSAFRLDVADVSSGEMFSRVATDLPTQPLTERVKHLARQAVDLPEVQGWIRQLEHDGEIRVPVTLRVGTEHAAGKSARLHDAGGDVDAVHRQITRDYYGRER